MLRDQTNNSTGFAWYFASATDNVGSPLEASGSPVDNFESFATVVRNGVRCTIPDPPNWSEIAINEAKKALPGFGPYVLNGTRSKANVVHYTALVWDIDTASDDQTMTLFNRLHALSVRGFAYESVSSGLAAKGTAARYRLVLAVDRPVSVSELPRLKAQIAGSLSVPYDPGAENVSQMFFVGRFASTPARRWIDFPGAPINVNDELAAVDVIASAPTAANALVEPAAVDVEWPAGVDHADVAAVIEPHFVKPNRHGLSLGLAGYLKNKGISQGDAAEVVSHLMNTENIAHHQTNVRDVYRHAGRAAGASKIRETFKDEPEVAKSIVDALDALFMDPRIKEIAAGLPVVHASPIGDVEQTEQQRPEVHADLSNARRIVHSFRGNARYFTAWRSWYVFDGRRWVSDEKGHVHALATRALESLWEEAKAEPDDDKRKAKFAWAVQCQNRQRIENAIALAQTEPGIPIVASELDSDPWLLNVENGTIDLRTGQLREHRREDLITKIAPVVFDPNAQSDLWERLLATWTNGDAELAGYIQRAIGYALFGEWREKAFWFAYGPKDGGKSTFVEAVKATLGDYAVAAAASTWLKQTNSGGNRGDVARLLGARLVTTSEIREGAVFDEELMKGVTGGDAIVAAAKYKDEISFNPTFALWFAANDRPRIREDDEAFWSRLRCVPFTNSIPTIEQDKSLGEKLRQPAERAAILAWAVHGCFAWQQHGLGSCAAVTGATDDYRRETDRLAGFLDECCELDANAQENAQGLRTAYDAWCTRNRVRPLQGKAWASSLKLRGVTGGDDASRVNGQRTWRGIRMRSNSVSLPSLPGFPVNY